MYKKISFVCIEIYGEAEAEEEEAEPHERYNKTKHVISKTCTVEWRGFFF